MECEALKNHSQLMTPDRYAWEGSEKGNMNLRMIGGNCPRFEKVIG
ncbi:MAG: hypothetical protein [Podoviridae sp. ctg2L5]|nr:MAG: hypothetical protein [Podoviridae sp. ctg2L5]